jgi:hypothetical protein
MRITIDLSSSLILAVVISLPNNLVALAPDQQGGDQERIPGKKFKCVL